MQDAFVGHDTRLRSLTRGERERLDSIARRARRISGGTVADGDGGPGRLYADVVTLLRIIGGEYGRDQERVL